MKDSFQGGGQGGKSYEKGVSCSRYKAEVASAAV